MVYTAGSKGLPGAASTQRDMLRRLHQPRCAPAPVRRRAVPTGTLPACSVATRGQRMRSAHLSPVMCTTRSSQPCTGSATEIAVPVSLRMRLMLSPFCDTAGAGFWAKWGCMGPGHKAPGSKAGQRQGLSGGGRRRRLPPRTLPMSAGTRPWGHSNRSRRAGASSSLLGAPFCRGERALGWGGLAAGAAPRPLQEPQARYPPAPLLPWMVRCPNPCAPGVCQPPAVAWARAQLQEARAGASSPS